MDSNITFIAITVCGNRVLLLKRNQEPLCWGPPSGHLKMGELMEDGIRREMMEETGLSCRILMPVTVWQGEHRGRDVFNVTFVCEVNSEVVVLSEEHSDAQWFELDRLEEAKGITLLDMTPWPVWIETARLCHKKLNLSNE